VNGLLIFVVVEGLRFSLGSSGSQTPVHLFYSTLFCDNISILLTTLILFGCLSLVCTRGAIVSTLEDSERPSRNILSATKTLYTGGLIATRTHESDGFSEVGTLDGSPAFGTREAFIVKFLIPNSRIFLMNDGFLATVAGHLGWW